MKHTPLGRHIARKQGPSPNSNSQKSCMSLSAVLKKDKPIGIQSRHHRGPGPNPESQKPTISVTMQTPKEQTENLTMQNSKPVSMNQLLAERSSAIQQQTQRCETDQDHTLSNITKGHKRRQISDGDLNLLKPLKRYLLYKKTENRKSMFSPDKKTPLGHPTPNSSFQSVYEQLNNTRLLSNSSRLTNSPYGQPKQRIARVIKEPEDKKVQQRFEVSVEDPPEKSTADPTFTMQTETPKTAMTKLKKNQNDKNSNKNNMMSQSQSMAAPNVQFKRAYTGVGVKQLGSPSTCPIYLTNSPLKLQTKSSTKVSQLNKSGAMRSPYNSQILLTKNNSTFASNQTMSLAYRSNNSKSKNLYPLSDSLHSSMHQLHSQNSQPQLYQPKYNKPKTQDLGSQKVDEELKSPYAEKFARPFADQQLSSNNYNQNTS